MGSSTSWWKHLGVHMKTTLWTRIKHLHFHHYIEPNGKQATRCVVNYRVIIPLYSVLNHRTWQPTTFHSHPPPFFLLSLSPQCGTSLIFIMCHIDVDISFTQIHRESTQINCSHLEDMVNLPNRHALRGKRKWMSEPLEINFSADCNM